MYHLNLKYYNYNYGICLIKSILAVIEYELVDY